MELLLILLGGLLVLFGFIGSFLPIVPGLPISLLGILILQWTLTPFSNAFIWGWTIAVILFSILDNFVPAWANQKIGGTRYGLWGTLLGMLLGFAFPPLGFILGPLIGAFVGELLGGQNQQQALRSAWGSFVGFMAATGIKVMAALVLMWYYGREVIRWAGSFM